MYPILSNNTTKHLAVSTLISLAGSYIDYKKKSKNPP